MVRGDLTVRLRHCAPGLGGCQPPCGARLDSKRPTPCPSHQRLPVVLSFRPSPPAVASAPWQHGQTGRASRRQEDVSLGSPPRAVRANGAAGLRPQKVQWATSQRILVPGGGPR